MGFIGWIRKVFGGAVHGVEDVVHLVRTGLSGLWHVLGNLGHSVGRAWHRFTGAVHWLLVWLEQIATAIAVRLRHILLVVIPHAITHAIQVAARFAQTVANRVESFARGAVKFLRDQLVRALNAVEAWARSAVKWLTGHLADAVNLLAKTARRVWSLLDDPAHLAEWVVGPMVRALARWARRNVVSLGRWLVRSAAGVVVESAPTIEDWIARIL